MVFIQDLKLALRNFVRKPAFSFMVVAMLALGIAGNAAIFSLFNGMFLRPLPAREPDRLVDIDETAPRWKLKFVSVAYPDFVAWRRDSRTFDGMAVYQRRSFNLSGHGQAQRIRGAAVTHEFATVLGLRPLMGRDLRPEEDRPGGTKVALLGYDLWRSQFSGDAKIMGQILQLDEQPYHIVGVLPREAMFPAEADIWVPLAADPNEGNGWYLSGIGRLKHGVTIEQARADLMRVHKALIPTRDVNQITSPVMAPIRERILGDFRIVTTILLGAVAIVLVIACVNVAGLMMVRASARGREIAIRTAMGAGRARIIRQLLTESLLLAVTASVLGVLLGAAGLRALLSLVPDNLPRWLTFSLDARFVTFCAIITGAAAALFGLVPAMQAAKADTRACLQEAAPRTTLSRARRKGLSVLVVGEIALALVLLISAGLLVQAFQKLMKVDPGFRAENVVTYGISLPGAKYAKADQRIAFYDELLRRLRAIPGVQFAGACTAPPLSGHWGNFFKVEGARPLAPNEQDPVVLQRVATPGYLEAIGVSFIAGRPFTDADGQNGKHAVIVNESFAKRFWPNMNPIGKRVSHRGPKSNWMDVVGVTRDIKHYGLDQEMRPGLYIAHRTNPVGGMYIVMRGSIDARSLVAPAREILSKLDPDLPMYQIMTMTEKMQRSLWARRAYSWMLGAFAAVALILAAAGIYGVISYAVSQRTHEIGIRMALGANPRQVLGQVLGQGLTLAVIGVALGVVVAVCATRLLESILLGVSARDPITYTIVALGVITVAVLANLVPARRAAAVDPMRALRFE
jgi:putative ABC transport system permease protein